MRSIKKYKLISRNRTGKSSRKTSRKSSRKTSRKSSRRFSRKIKGKGNVISAITGKTLSPQEHQYLLDTFTLPYVQSILHNLNTWKNQVEQHIMNNINLEELSQTLQQTQNNENTRVSHEQFIAVYNSIFDKLTKIVKIRDDQGYEFVGNVEEELEM